MYISNTVYTCISILKVEHLRTKFSSLPPPFFFKHNSSRNHMCVGGIPMTENEYIEEAEAALREQLIDQKYICRETEIKLNE